MNPFTLVAILSCLIGVILGVSLAPLFAAKTIVLTALLLACVAIGLEAV